MDIKIGDQVRYNYEGIDIFKEEILQTGIYFGKVIDIENNPYMPNEKMITFEDSLLGNKHLVRSMYLEKGSITYEYLFALAFRTNTLDKYSDSIKDILKKYKNNFKFFNNYSRLLTTKSSIDLLDIISIVENNKDLFDNVIVKDAAELKNNIIKNSDYKQKINILSIYILSNEIDDLINEIYNSKEYKNIEALDDKIIINKIDDGYCYSFSGYDNSKKLIKVSNKIFKNKK